jgi:hypothetical protein
MCFVGSCEDTYSDYSEVGRFVAYSETKWDRNATMYDDAAPTLAEACAARRHHWPL